MIKIRSKIFLFIFFSLAIHADIKLSSPIVDLNSTNQRTIEFKIRNAELKESEIELFSYKTTEPLIGIVEYSLLQTFPNYQSYKLVLNENFTDEYISFTIKISSEYKKDIFIFLPAKPNVSIREKIPLVKKPLPAKKISDDSEVNDQQELTKEKPEDSFLKIVKAEEITTIWSIASEIASENSVSIYKVMWSIYLGNKDSFINKNINRVRSDIDLVIPKLSIIKNISEQDARKSILAMNQSYQQSFVKASQSLLKLTAPKIQKPDSQDNISAVEVEEKPSIIQAEYTDLEPENIIEQNTKTISIGNTNDAIEELIEKPDDENRTSKNSGLNIWDLLFVAAISVASGVLISLIYIQLKTNKSKKVAYDFDEPKDDHSKVQGLPDNLSVENNKDEQELDLAFTYFEMGKIDLALNILEKLKRETSNTDIRNQAISLIARIKE